jgi:hypothetical protein
MQIPETNLQEERLIKMPLWAFSPYLCGRSELLLSTSKEIIEKLETAFTKDGLKFDELLRASDLNWYWTLGAYELVRTISQAKDCFSQEFIEKVMKVKKMLSKVRMPNAKMEKEGRKEIVTSYRSPDRIDSNNKDLLIGDPDDAISARELIHTFIEIMTTMKPSDVIKPHEKSNYYSRV